MVQGGRKLIVIFFQEVSDICYKNFIKEIIAYITVNILLKLYRDHCLFS